LIFIDFPKFNRNYHGKFSPFTENLLLPVNEIIDRMSSLHPLDHLWNTDVTENWIHSDYLANQGFILDYGCVFIIENVFMKQMDREVVGGPGDAMQIRGC
jgi:hypothetical protein